MLEIVNLTKVYRPKRGVPVTALDHISLRLPQQGMVFLLGKSGSGKSTLLNLLGGLDKYDEGEIRIKGVSSRGFRQQHFDSYRNTYVGFIFQEYNILEEFTVGANIALAIELQGTKATDEQINDILRQVDMEGYGSRRPNELSGGQKQRVAIARALVKQPRIIMADEPTGALDSHTGRQIFDTLKKLSAQRLVIVVSHDREFAEQYADRIIELADGRVISDMTYTEAAPAADEPLRYEGEQVAVAAGYHLTEEDRLAINAYMDSLQKGLTLRLGRQASGKKATPTDNNAIQLENDGFQSIKSRLPLRSAFKIGAGALKHKRIRLAVTILLSCIAFGLFGLADTFGSYNHIRACTDSLLDSKVNYASVQETRRVTEGEGDNAYTYYENGYFISDGELADIAQQTGVSMKGVYLPSHTYLNFDDHFADTEALKNERLYTDFAFNGFSEMTAEDLQRWGFTLTAGRLPDGAKNEIAIPKHIADLFVRVGYMDGEGNKTAIPSPDKLVDKVLNLAGTPYTVTGVVDTHLDLSRYEILNEKRDNLTTAQELLYFALQTELSYVRQYSLHTVAFTGSGFVASRVAAAYPVRSLNRTYLVFVDKDQGLVLDPYSIGTLSDIRDTKVTWLDGKARTALGDKELVISVDLLESLGLQEIPPVTPSELTALIRDTLHAYGPLEEQSERVWQLKDDADRAQYGGYTVVGYLDPATVEKGLRSTVITATSLKDALVTPDEGYYDYAVGNMPTEEEQVHDLVSFCYGENAVRYELRNAVTYELDTIHEVLAVLSKVFLYVGIGFALFAALMLTNFISTSIAYKKQEIGILRAIGSRSNDVFRIFFSESFLIAMINFLLAGTGVGVATAVINYVIRSRLNILVTILHFGLRQVVLLFAVSLLVAAVASFFPVRHIAAKRPIDAIGNR